MNPSGSSVSTQVLLLRPTSETPPRHPSARTHLLTIRWCRITLAKHVQHLNATRQPCHTASPCRHAQHISQSLCTPAAWRRVLVALDVHHLLSALDVQFGAQLDVQAAPRRPVALSGAGGGVRGQQVLTTCFKPRILSDLRGHCVRAARACAPPTGV